MGISYRDGMEIAEAAAFAKMGERNSWWFVWGKRLAPVAAVAVGLAAVGYGLHWLWERTASLFAGEIRLSGDLGGGTIVVGVVLFVLTVLAVRGRANSVRSFGMLLLTGAGILAMWGGFAMFVIAAAG